MVESVTLIVAVPDPRDDGVPDMTPVADAIDKPAGKAVADQERGATPPVAATVAE